MRSRLKVGITLATTAVTAALSVSAVGAAENEDGDDTRTGAQVVQEAPAPELEPSAPADSSPDAAGVAVSAVANHIYSVWRESGYVSQRADAESVAVSVVWSGPVPEDLAAYAASKPWGVSISIKTGARYDRAALWAGRDRILQDSIADDIRIKTTELNIDGSGITLGVLTKTPLSDTQMQRLREISGIDTISVSTVENTDHLFSSRGNDTHPFKAEPAPRHRDLQSRPNRGEMSADVTG